MTVAGLNMFALCDSMTIFFAFFCFTLFFIKKFLFSPREFRPPDAYFKLKKYLLLLKKIQI